MLKFFKKIRLQLLADKKLSRYLTYALGEIILVVVGILIALAINNLNQKRIQKNNEQIYLLGLKEEFQTSKEKLGELIAVNKMSYDGAIELLEHISNTNQTLTERRFSELLYNSFSFDIAFNPNNSLLTEMISSGSLKGISNTSLRIQLTNWISTLEDVSRQESELSTQREKILDLFRTDQYSLRTILDQTGANCEFGLSKSTNQRSNLSLLNAVEFENNLLMFIITSSATENAHYRPLMDDINSILQLIENEISLN
ncbi:DUF6090 family protein [Mangrovibacterium marinum]|uniref:Uncharacterized protein n=1 Tax=Mangrovibacterium marinum TaxID=1639118 RepID=A0A2T5C161_9BACT|nr:DUF6090 family protein [Mangrovibacterium marinum]PTN08367.1 hypothetical protein C8N47_109103 [Mangrovibacterium marinum]